MEVILLTDYPALGFVGDRMAVRNGYARNFLIPRGLAVEYSSRGANNLKQWVQRIEAIKAARKQEAEQQSGQLQTIVLEFKLRIGEQGKSYGSVGLRDIQQALAEKGVAVDRKQIKLAEPIKRAGEFQVQLKLHSEVVVPVKLLVSAADADSGAQAAAEDSAPAAKTAAAGEAESAASEEPGASELVADSGAGEPDS